jgi:hypothetical protein
MLGITLGASLWIALVCAAAGAVFGWRVEGRAQKERAGGASG